jgi:nitrite reductase/ring-hydroxylating ferredoxin subunit
MDATKADRETDFPRREFLGLAALMAASACGGGGGGGGGGGTPGPSLPAIASFTVSPTSVAQGQGATLAWSVSGATALAIDAPGGGNVLGLSSLQVTPAQTTVYTLSATNTAGTVSRTVTLTVVPPPDLSLAFGSAGLSVAPGGSGAVSVLATRSGGFSAELALTLLAPPAGLGGAFSPNPMTGSASTLTVQAGAGIAPGTYGLTVQASGGGLTRTATLNVTVPSGGDFDLAPASATLDTVQGGNGTLTINIPRSGGFNGEVTLSLQGAPAGVTGTFVPNPAPGATAALTVAVGAAVAPGAHPLTVQGVSGALVHGAALTLNVAQPADFSLGVASPAVSVVQGGNVSVGVNLTRIAGFGGAVTLALLDAPAGLTGVFTPNPAPGDAASLALTALASVAPGIHPLRVQGTSGALVRTAGLSATVTAAPDFSLSASPGIVNASQGGSVATTITLARIGGFSGPVALSLLGAPAGVTGNFTPASATGTSSSLSLLVDVSVAPGTYALTVQGQNGALVHSAPLSLVVSQSTTLITTNDTKASFTTNTCRAYLAGNQEFFLCKDNGGIYALTSICTHQGCTIGFKNPPPNSVTFQCPCHGSQYDENGFNTQGPALLPLVHYLVTEPSPGANLVVNKGVTVGASTRLT